ncbi:MAG: hypothetical protein GQF41_2548 [Candidatus Rifleibacterium amylolyticum]|jgi:Flp pilus assembly protein TadG|nr:MAG: hypothetical protein GQF41_2548 [Candidatus Rifleibacterium amylolyticum]NLF95131.1 pilus assembly protein [Candidatus Riflebacteria bacterium]
MKTHAKSRGQAVVEMALVLPIFIFVIVGIFDFGRALHSWSTLNFQCTKAARLAAKRLSPLIARNLYTPETHTPLGQQDDVYGVHDEFWKYRSPTMAEADYDVTFEGVGTGTQNVTISATYNLKLITPFMGSILGGSNGDGTIVISSSVTEEKE